MSFLKGSLDYLKIHIYSIFRVLKFICNCQMTWDLNSRTFLAKAPCAKHPHKGLRIEQEIGYYSMTQWLNGSPLVTCHSSFFFQWLNGRMEGCLTPS